MDPSPARVALAAMVFILPLVVMAGWSLVDRRRSPARTAAPVRFRPDESAPESWRSFWRTWLGLGAVGVSWMGSALGILLGNLGRGLLWCALAVSALIGYAALLKRLRLESAGD